MDRKQYMNLHHKLTVPTWMYQLGTQQHPWLMFLGLTQKFKFIRWLLKHLRDLTIYNKGLKNKTHWSLSPLRIHKRTFTSQKTKHDIKL